MRPPQPLWRPTPLPTLTALRAAGRADAETLHGQKVFLLVELYLGLNVAGHAVLGVYKSLTNKFSRARLPPLPPPAASHQRHTRGPV